ncbi:MAG: YrbL family protein [Pseudomonadota bacterium]
MTSKAGAGVFRHPVQVNTRYRMLNLKYSRPLFVGGTRYCFAHPQYGDRCVKVLRPDRTGEVRKRYRKDFKRYLPARFLDDQRKEIIAYEALDRTASAAHWRHVPRYHGTVATDMGLGIVTELLRNEDGSWPKNLRELFSLGEVRAQSHDDADEREAITTRPAQDQIALLDGIDEFLEAVRELRILSRDLLAHNIVALKEESRYRVVLVDGIGNAELIPVSSWSDLFAARKVERKIARFRQRYRKYLTAS